MTTPQSPIHKKKQHIIAKEAELFKLDHSQREKIDEEFDSLIFILIVVGIIYINVIYIMWQNI